MKLLINEKLEKGNTEKEIYDFLKNQYGDWIVYDPKFGKKLKQLEKDKNDIEDYIKKNRKELSDEYGFNF